MNDQITVTREQLLAAFLRWEQDVVAGNVISDEQLMAMTIEERAEASTVALLRHLEALRAPA